MGWLVPYSSLTPAQQQAAMLPLDGHRVILGGPGAGKTLVLLHRFSHLFQSHACDQEAGKLFVFTTTLKDFIRSALTDVDVPQECVTTFDKWCADIYRAHVRPSLPWRTVGKAKGPDFAAIRDAVHDLVVKKGIMKEHYAFSVVDEGQDLTRQAMEIIAGVSRHVTVAMDAAIQSVAITSINQQDKWGVELNSSGYFCKNLILLSVSHKPECAPKKITPRLS